MTDVDPDARRGARAWVARARKPAIGSAVVVAHVWLIFFLALLGLDLETLVSGTTDRVTFPHVSAVTLTVWGLAAVLVWPSARLLRSLGDRSGWVPATALPLVSLVLFVPISMAWRKQYGSLPDPVALTVGTAVLSFLVLRWRMTGTQLPLRAPLAVVASLATALSLAFSTVIVEVSVYGWSADRRLGDLTVGALGNDPWEVTWVYATDRTHDDTTYQGIRVEYRNPEADLSASVYSFPKEYWTRYDTLDDCECERRGPLVVDESHLRPLVIVETEGFTFGVEAPEAFEFNELIGLVDHVRPANSAEEEDVRRGLVDYYLGTRRSPPPTGVLVRD